MLIGSTIEAGREPSVTTRPPRQGPVSADWLTANFESRILRHELPPGMRLPSERVLAEQYGLSRPAIREVLSRLSERGFVEKQPGRGAFVREVQPVDAARPLEMLYLRQRVTARALIDARRMLEGEAAALAATRATVQDVARLEGILDRLELTSEDLLVRARADLDFHAAIVDLAGNPVIATMFSSIRQFAIQQMLRSLSDRAVVRQGVPHHRDIFDAIRDNDPARARQAVEGHMGVSLELYGADLDEPIEELARQTVERIAGSDWCLEDVYIADFL